MAPPGYLHKDCPSQEEANKIVTNAGLIDGQFLVRPRTGKKGQFVLCVVFKGKPTHHLIAKGADGNYLINKKPYGGHKKVTSLIRELSTKTTGWPVPLDKPILVDNHTEQSNKQSTAGRKSQGHPESTWFAGQLSRAEAEAAVVVGGADDGNFIVRIRDGKVGEYVLCVIYKGKPTHHLIVAGSDGALLINKRKYGNAHKIAELVNELSKKAPGWPVPLTSPMWKSTSGDDKTMTTSSVPVAPTQTESTKPVKVKEAQTPQDVKQPNPPEATQTPKKLPVKPKVVEPQKPVIPPPVVRKSIAGERTIKLTSNGNGDFGFVAGGARYGPENGKLGVYVKQITPDGPAAKQGLCFGWQIVAVEGVDTCSATLQYLSVALLNAAGQISLTVVQNDELFISFEGKPPRLVNSAGIKPKPPPQPKKEPGPLLSGTAKNGIWSEGSFSEDTQVVLDGSSMSIATHSENAKDIKDGGEVLWFAPIADDDTVQKHDGLSVNFEISYERKFVTDDLYLGIAGGGKAVCVRLSTVRLFNERELVKQKHEPIAIPDSSEGITKEFLNVKPDTYGTVKLRRASKIAVDLRAAESEAEVDTLTYEKSAAERKWRLGVNYSTKFDTVRFSAFDEVDGITVDGVDPQSFVISLSWDEGDKTGLVTVEDKSTKIATYMCTGLPRLDFTTGLCTWIGTNTSKAQYKLTDFIMSAKHTKAPEPEPEPEPMPSPSGQDSLVELAPGRTKQQRLNFWREIEKKILPTIKDPTQAQAFWGISDFNDDRAINLADVETRVQSQFPVLRHELALIQAFRRTYPSNVEGSDSGTWIRPIDLKYFITNLLYLNKFYSISRAIVDKSCAVNHLDFHVLLELLGDHRTSKAAFEQFCTLHRDDKDLAPLEQCGNWYVARFAPERKISNDMSSTAPWEPVYAMKGIWNPQVIAIESGYSAGFVTIDDDTTRIESGASHVQDSVERINFKRELVFESANPIVQDADGTFRVELCVWTSNVPAAAAKRSLKISFMVNSIWTEEEPFFAGAAAGEKRSSVFTGLMAPPSAVRLIKYDDQWGFWKLTANGVDILKNPHGDRGSDLADSLYWLRPARSVSIYGEALRPSASHDLGFYSVYLEVRTSRAPGAGTVDLVYASFLCRCPSTEAGTDQMRWTPKLKFFTGCRPGEMRSRLFEMLPGPVVSIKLSKYGNDDWGFWRIAANSVEVLRDPRGEVGTKFALDSPYWIHSSPLPRNENGPWIETLSRQDELAEAVGLTEKVFVMHTAVVAVQTSQAWQSGTSTPITASFCVYGSWTEPEILLEKSNAGDHHRKRFELQGPPTQLRLAPAHNDDGSTAPDGWGIYKISVNNVDILEDPKGIRGRPFASTPYWIGGLVEGAPLVHEYDLHFADVVVATSQATNAGTGSKVFVQFYALDHWTDPAPFFDKADRGQVISKRFAGLSGEATRLRFICIGDDTWGFWRLEVNSHEILRSSNGSIGPSLGRSKYWLDGSGMTAAKIVEYSLFEVDVAVHTSIAEFADTIGQVNASFLVNGMWTAPQHLFTGAKKGQMIQKRFTDLLGVPTRIRLSRQPEGIDSTVIPMWAGGDETQTAGGAEVKEQRPIVDAIDYFGFDEEDVFATANAHDAAALTEAWGYWRIVVNGREVLRDPRGIVGSSFGQSTFWLSPTLRPINEYRIDTSKAAMWWEGGLFGKHFNGQSTPTRNVTLSAAKDYGVMWWRQVPVSPALRREDGLLLRIHVKYTIRNRTADKFALTQPPGKTQVLPQYNSARAIARAAGVEVFESFGHRSSEYERLEAQLLNTRRTDDLFIGISAGTDVLCVSKRPIVPPVEGDDEGRASKSVAMTVTLEYPQGNKAGSISVEDARNPLRSLQQQSRWTLENVGRLPFTEGLRVFLAGDKSHSSDKSEYVVTEFACEVEELEADRYPRWTSLGSFGDKARVIGVAGNGVTTSATNGIFWWHTLLNSAGSTWKVPPGHEIVVKTRLKYVSSVDHDFCVGIASGGQAVSLGLSRDTLSIVHAAHWSAEKQSGTTVVETLPRQLDDGDLAITFRGGDGYFAISIGAVSDGIAGSLRMQMPVRLNMLEGIRVFIAAGENPAAALSVEDFEIGTCRSEPTTVASSSWPKFGMSTRSTASSAKFVEGSPAAAARRLPKYSKPGKSHMDFLNELSAGTAS